MANRGKSIRGAQRLISFYEKEVDAAWKDVCRLTADSKIWQDRLQAIDREFKQLIDHLEQLHHDVWEEFKRTGKPPLGVRLTEEE